ncbi:MAG: SIR2 family protein [Clostridia bacterium]|nr:SIR2 family protein [Clostridia bacterium]
MVFEEVKMVMEFMKKHNNLNEFLFLVGSGISCSCPASLPLGNGLTEFVLEESCGKEIADVILNTWNKSKDIIHDYDNSLVFPCPRLETICGCIYELDDILNRESILKGFQSYSKILPNENHQILAALLNNGANIITTNFDLGIENAFAENHGVISAFETNGICGYETSFGSSIFHLHGCSNNEIDKLGTTISKVKSGFSEKAKEVLITLINKATQVIVLGYGAVDTFDIIPLFQDERIKGKHILYVQHSTEPQESKKFKVPFYWHRMSSNFSSNKFEANDTTIFLKEFTSKNGISITAEKPMVDNQYDWKEKFKTAWGYQYSEEEKLINFLAIRYQLGFNPRIVESIYPSIIEKIKYISKKSIYNHPRIKDYFAMALKDFDIPKHKTFSKSGDIVKSKTRFVDKQYLICLRDECDYYLDLFKR